MEYRSGRTTRAYRRSVFALPRSAPQVLRAAFAGIKPALGCSGPTRVRALHREVDGMYIGIGLGTLIVIIIILVLVL